MSKIDSNDIVRASVNFVVAVKYFGKTISSVTESVLAFNKAMYHFRMRQKELRHLEIKSYTLGLTYLEKQRLK